MAAAHRLGCSLPHRQVARLGFRPNRKAPCHATLTETVRVLEPDVMALAFSRFAVPLSGGEEDVSDPRQIAIDGKTLRGGKDAEGKAEHVPCAFCSVRASGVISPTQSV